MGAASMPPSNFFQWFGIYLASGAVTLFTVFTIAALVDNPKLIRTWPHAVYESVMAPGDDRSFWARHREMVIMLPLIWAFWPLAILIATKVVLIPDRWKPDPEAAFTCRRHHLMREVAPEAAENESTIFDPNGRVPALPFGHLNAGWCALLANREKQDHLWYFELPGDATREGGTLWPVPQGAKRGYALVREGKVCAEFIFEWD